MSPFQRNMVRVSEAAGLLHEVGDENDRHRPSCSSLRTSSMRIVVTGSMAMENSSRQRISARCESARAMVRRCCCPPESLVPSEFEAVLHFIPERGLAETLLNVRVEEAFVVDAGAARGEGDVVVDRERQTDGQRRDHADLAAQAVNVAARLHARPRRPP
jgi:hypothetical protein